MQTAPWLMNIHLALKTHVTGLVHWCTTALFHSPAVARCAISFGLANISAIHSTQFWTYPVSALLCACCSPMTSAAFWDSWAIFSCKIVVSLSSNGEISNVHHLHISQVVNAFALCALSCWFASCLV